MRRWWARDHQTLTAYLFLLPNIVGFLAFSALPVLAALVLSLYDWDLLLGRSFVGLGNFRQLLDDAVFRAAFVNTFYFSAVSVPLSVGLGLAAALLTNQTLRGVTIFRGIFLLPYVTITVALSLVWKWLYLPNVGLMNQLLALVGIAGPAWLVDPIWAMPGLILMSAWKSFGYNMVLFLAGLQSIPQHLYEAAMIDGATAWRRFLHVTLPMLSPTTFFVVVIALINSFQVFDQALIMTNGGPGTATTTLVLHIYQVGFQSFHMGYAAAVAWVLFAVVFAFTVVQFRAQRRWVTYE
ncbi:MAG TPA: sugar ABC transporter permease [Chloroflexota bacterium]|nr:sugar ABC transporter permease [Chloroflexota bacterium]